MDLPATNVGRTKLRSVAIHLFQAGSIIANMISFVITYHHHYCPIIIDIAITTIRNNKKGT